MSVLDIAQHAQGATIRYAGPPPSALPPSALRTKAPRSALLTPHSALLVTSHGTRKAHPVRANRHHHPSL
eukprot:2206508-Rhodomonas_salina.2